MILLQTLPQMDINELQNQIRMHQIDFQEWMKNISILEMLFKGLLIGIMASAPMGPVGILCVQRTLNKGRWPGFATGVGAALSDIVYAFVTGLGLSFLVDIIHDPIYAYWMKIIGSGLLLVFGVYTYRSNPVNNVRPVTRTKTGSLISNFITGFFVTFSNPLMILAFGAMFGMFTFVLNENPLAMIAGYVGIILGALLWWFALTWLVDKVRKNYNARIIWILNRAIGVAVMVAAGLMLTYTLTGHSFPNLIKS